MSDLQESASIDDIVTIPKRMPRWLKLDSGELLAQFHAKFWGTSMADEENEWHNSQPPIASGFGDEDQDGDERMDEGESTDLDDDIIPGCYLLDIGIEGFDFSKIWVRAEYKRVYDFVEYHRNKPAIPPGKAPSTVVTGQPGIGAFSLSPFLSQY
jgi:hypothetical protein